MIVGLEESRRVDTNRFNGCVSPSFFTLFSVGLVGLVGLVELATFDGGVLDGRGNGPGSTRETAGYSPLMSIVCRKRDTSFLVSFEAVEFLRIFVLALRLSSDRPPLSNPPGRFAFMRSSETTSAEKCSPKQGVTVKIIVSVVLAFVHSCDFPPVPHWPRISHTGGRLYRQADATTQ